MPDPTPVARIYHYRGFIADDSNRPVSVLEEPYGERQTVDLSSGLAASQPSPAGTYVARVVPAHVSGFVRYRVRLEGDTSDADADDPLLWADWIHCPPGATVSLFVS